MVQRESSAPPAPGPWVVRRLRVLRRLVPLALLVAALVVLMHSSPAHACGTATAPSSTPTAPAHSPGHPQDHGASSAAASSSASPPGAAPAAPHHGAAPAAGGRSDDGGTTTGAQSGTAGAGGGAGQHCSSATPPQAPVLGAGAVVTTAAATAPDLTRAASPVLRTGDRGPPTALRPVLCVWRV